MIFKNRIIQLVVCTLVGSSLFGQDIHFTQFTLAPLTVNPAMTGGFYGTVRFGGLYRDQWGSTYATPAFYIDSPILKGFRDKDWIGVGLSFYQDQARADYLPSEPGQASRSGTLKTGGALGSIAYHLALDDERKTVLAVGIQGGTLARSVEGDYQFEDQILNGGGASMDMLPDEDSPRNFLDISGGITLTGQTEGASYYRIGVSAMHINQPSAGILGSSNDDWPMRIVGFGTYHWDVNEKYVVLPSVLYQSMGSASELAVQGMAGYKMPKESVVVKGGLGYRVGDALEVLVGLDYKDLRVGASYDLTLSDLSAPNGAFELAVAYIAKIYKRPKIDPVIFCPRF